MTFVQRPNALGRGDDGHELHRLRACLLDGLDCGGCRVSRGEHRVEEDDVAVGDVGRELDVVLDRLERLLVPIEADEPDAGSRDEREDAVQHPDAGPEDRADRHLLARDARHGRPLEWGLDLDLLDGEILRHLVREQERYLVDELAEHLGRRLQVPEQPELVLNERVVDHGHLRGGDGRAHVRYSG
jgi:hypothetical protein